MIQSHKQYGDMYGVNATLLVAEYDKYDSRNGGLIKTGMKNKCCSHSSATAKSKNNERNVLLSFRS